MGQHTVFCVDDDENILRSLERLFTDEGYTLITVCSGEEALEKLKSATVSLVISDQRMPGMQGIDLLKRVREISPDTMCILLTGHADIKAAISAINSGAVYKYIEKPWDDVQLKITVRRALEQYDLLRRNKKLNEIVKEQNAELKYLNKNLEDKVLERTEEIARQNVRLEELNERLKKNFIDTTRVFGALVEMRDEYVGGHSKRVAVASKGVASMLRLPEEETFDIEVAALLHDIGKIGLKDDLLRIQSFRPGDPGNRELQQQHAVMGQMSLAGIDGLQAVAKLIRHHHENYDGTGVPDGLKGEDIPLGSRIIAVIDAFDSLRFRRKPQLPFSEKAACSCLEKLSNTKFDPEVVGKLFEFLEGLRAKEPRRKIAKVTSRAMHEDMVLAHDIITNSNMLLVAHGERMKQSYLEKIRYYVERGQIEDEFYVYDFEEVKKPVPSSTVK
ncbi:response regulator [Candidatus Poribacteria bacterium]|nr:response regulator [Candidatus Poribacteria bacterium]